MDFEIWDYPELNTLSSIKNSTSVPPEPTALEIQQEQERLAHTEALKQHLQVVRNISQTLSQQFHDLNDTLFTNIVQLIKKTAEKVIQKELALDNERFQDMLKQALTEIQRDNAPCTIYVAVEQHQYLVTHEAMPAEITLQPDPTLKSGDFRIKTVYSELESIIENRLNELFAL